jgi:hypothetical protein
MAMDWLLFVWAAGVLSSALANGTTVKRPANNKNKKIRMDFIS